MLALRCLLKNTRMAPAHSLAMEGDFPGGWGGTRQVMDAVELVEEMYGREHVEGASHVKDLTGDKGYHSSRELGIILEAAGIRTIISDPNAARRQPANPGTEAGRAVAKAARAVESKSGKALLQKRGEQIERGVAHVPDCGGLRRTTPRGRINNNKR